MMTYLNKIICGDCIKLMQNLGNSSVDLILTDIPYGEVNRKSNKLRNLDKNFADVETFNLNEFLYECVRVCKGSIYIFCGIEQVSFIRKYFVAEKLSTRLCIWEKTNPSPMNGQHIWLSGIECCVYGKKKGATFNEHCKNSVWRYPSGRGKFHPTEKPLKLFQYIIKASSNQDDVVLDPCIGSGTTANAAILEGRNYIGFEINEECIDYVKQRIAKVRS